MTCPTCQYSQSLSITSPPSPPVPCNTRIAYVPSQSEAKLIRATVADAQAVISQINQELLRLRLATDRLSHQRHAFQKHVEEQNALLSPVRSLHPELAAEIFSHCIPAWRRRASPHHKRAMMLCSHVCGRWRDIALSTPRLW
ncbi:hypothetical protein PILCRDRAFT_64097, partial [Piloderma croceum F 1598]